MKKNAIVIDYKPDSVKETIKKSINETPRRLKEYLFSIFPIIKWIHRYNLTWLYQDAIAGITVGIVIVPQSMAYAKLAGLGPQYGLYTSFVGVCLYCFFGTSKDISIGPISTVSLLVGSAIHSVVKVNPSIMPTEVAVTLGLFVGIVSIIISLLRLGLLVDFIPEPAIAGYMTGSAITIVLSQVPKLFGIPDVPTDDAPYLVLGNVIEKLPNTHLDVAFGLVSLLFLYGVKILCNRINCRSPTLQKSIFLFGIMRNGLIVIVGTLISFLINLGKKESPIGIIQTVPAGFDAMQVPQLHMDIIREAGSSIPSIVLVLILEHISVAKAFGRIYDYQIDPNQEILAIGVSNAVGSFFGGYPCTGAFSRTAIMARSGVKTPMGGVFSALVVVVALYALTPAFYYIPDAVLAAVVIHAVSDLVSGKKYLKELWKASIAEFFVWTSAVLVTVFVSIETGIYTAVGLSLIIMLYKIARPSIKTIGRIPLDDDNSQIERITLNSYSEKHCDRSVTDDCFDENANYLYVDEVNPNFQKYATDLPSGIIAMRLCDSMLYPNAEYIYDAIVHTVKSKTRCGNITEINKKDCERTWNQDLSSTAVKFGPLQQPVLEALILDFGAVCRLDSTALETLRILRETLNRYAGGSAEFHFTGLQNQSVRSLLLNTGFGSFEIGNQRGISSSNSSGDSSLVSLESAHSHTILSTSSNNKISIEKNSTMIKNSSYDLEMDSSIDFNLYNKDLDSTVISPHIFVPTDKYPCFHWDIDTAVLSVCKRWHKNQITHNASSKLTADI